MRLYFVLLFLLMVIFGCSHSSKKYIEEHPELSSQKIWALRSQQIINGMSVEEVTAALGEPTFKEKINSEGAENRWIYRLTEAGQSLSNIYTPPSSFPQGIFYILPHYYPALEIRVDFYNDKVCRVQEILAF